jgi:16S rRNA (uracil1498-N3)-methyltransferase
MHLFYSKDFSRTNPMLDEKESHHAIHVLRLQKNDIVSVGNGKGNVFVGSIGEIQKKGCSIIIQDEKPLVDNSAKGFHLAVSPTKSMDRIEWLVEKCTELGIEQITFLKSRYSERKDLNIAKLHAIAAGAMKQSQRAYLPVLTEMITFTDFVKQQNENQQTFIACQHQSMEVNEWVKMLPNYSRNCIMIGPEGGFSEEEVILAIQNNIQPISLGANRLRTETAAISACHLLNIFNT